MCKETLIYQSFHIIVLTSKSILDVGNTGADASDINLSSHGGAG